MSGCCLLVPQPTPRRFRAHSHQKAPAAPVAPLNSMLPDSSPSELARVEDVATAGAGAAPASAPAATATAAVALRWLAPITPPTIAATSTAIATTTTLPAPNPAPVAAPPILLNPPKPLPSALLPSLLDCSAGNGVPDGKRCSSGYYRYCYSAPPSAAPNTLIDHNNNNNNYHHQPCLDFSRGKQPFSDMAAAAVGIQSMPESSGALASAFSPYSDSPSSPLHSQSYKRSSTDSTGHLHPQPQRSPGLGSASDLEGPSPIASSNGTEFDDTGVEESVQAHGNGEKPQLSSSPAAAETVQRSPIKVETKDKDGQDFKPAASEEEHPSSVIHAPKGFETFQRANRSPPAVGRTTPTPSQRSDVTVISAQDDDGDGDGGRNNTPLSPPPISTAVPPMTDRFKTPTAQTRQEVEGFERDRFSRPKSSLADIPESHDTELDDGDGDDDDQNTALDGDTERFRKAEDDLATLRLALGECWTLCNTLAGLSHNHRERTFRRSPSADGREQAWKSCWTLCQRLYNTWDEDQPSEVAPTLHLCREFCQALFEARQRDNDVADSVLRVSFELNNHLYNTHDRALPEAFRERTLDFYITLCHRLMKQRNKLGEETDALLRACWSLAEMLFSLRQNKREGKPADDELLGSAVQACWELCDLFREGWTQIRPDRGTPRPSQATFTQAFHQAKQSEAITITLEEGDEEDEDLGRQNPETPTTIFEDSAQSPDEASVPNIIVLGPESKERYTQWPSSSSVLSGYSTSDERASSNTTTTTTSSSTASTVNPASPLPAGTTNSSSEDPRLTCLKLLVVQAATNLGFTRDGYHSDANGSSLAAFAKSLPSNSFGVAAWQADLLDSYKRLVTIDPDFRYAGPVRRASAPDVATSVRWMVRRAGRYAWLEDLYRWVFGFHVDEAQGKGNVVVQS